MFSPNRREFITGAAACAAYAALGRGVDGTRIGIRKDKHPLCKVGNVMPYDAEVEYLESSGTQYIDTLRPPFADDNITFEFLLPDFQSWKNYFGSMTTQTGTDVVRLQQVADTNVLRCGFGYENTQLGAVSKNVKYTLRINKTNASLSNGSSIDYAQRFTSSVHNMIIFGIREGSTEMVALSKIKVYAFNIVNNGILTIDLTPVRIGNVGYMYDRVTGKLFGNAGTGNFVLGPDKQ